MPDTATAAAIDEALYRAWAEAKVNATLWAAKLKETEALIRDQTSGAKTVTVNGVPAMLRITRKAENVTWTSDYYRRAGKDRGDD